MMSQRLRIRTPALARYKALSSQTPIALAFLAPALVLLSVFTFYPVLYGTYLAFTDYTAASLGKGIGPVWNNFQNFNKVFSDPLFTIGILNSLKYLIVVPILQIFSLAIAVLVNRNLPAMAFFRSAYYVPVITSISVASTMWEWVYNRDGLINWVLGILGLVNQQSSFSWLGNPSTALYAIMFVTFWRGFGYYMVLYLSGLQNIPTELEESARLDGANPWQIFWFIIIPLMRPTILLCSLLSTISALRVLEEILVFNPEGGPLNSTYTALLYVYRKALGGLDFDYGQASAAGLVIALVGFAFSYLNFRITKGGNAS
jgi:putative chitobiose transport system permease protein